MTWKAAILSDRSLLILAPAFDAAESARGLENLGRLDLPHATKFVVTRGKFAAGAAVKTFNIDSGYPAEIAQLQSLATTAGKAFRDDLRFRDGYDLFCIRRLLDKHSGFDLLLLLRDPMELEQGWPDLSQRAVADLFVVGGSNARNLLLNFTDPRCRAFLQLATALYRSGAAFSIPHYDLAAALTIAREALDLVSSGAEASSE